MARKNRGDAGNSFDILLVQPDPDEISPFIDSFEETGTTNEVHVVADGDEAIDYVRQRGEYEDVARPDLILLDLHLSGPGGEQVLRELKEHSELRRIPVIVFAASDEAEDVAQSYQLYANAYVRKPDDEAAFERLAQAIEDFWLTHASLPPK